jgi:hypothetical protein
VKDDDKTLSRAGMIDKLVVAPIAIGAFAALCAEAQAAPTMDPKAAAYQTKPNGSKECSNCSLFIPSKSNPKGPGTCQLVKGSIVPNGYCKFYSAKAH